MCAVSPPGRSTTWSPRSGSTRGFPSHCRDTLSRLCAGLDEVVTAFRTRRLDHIAFPYVYLDATYLHVRNQTSQVVSMAVVVASGVRADGDREILGLDVGDSLVTARTRCFGAPSSPA